jgi:cysteine desulfurase/selenocysteine lyase
MILSVRYEHTDYNVIPFKFEAGTPAIAAAIGLATALDYVNAIGLERIAAHEHELLNYATEALARIPEVRIIGSARAKAGVISFEVGDVHPHDVGSLLNDEGIAIRAGHHCAQPVMQCYGVAATARASFALYNTLAEVDALVAGILKVKKVFG